MNDIANNEIINKILLKIVPGDKFVLEKPSIWCDLIRDKVITKDNKDNYCKLCCDNGVICKKNNHPKFIKFFEAYPSYYQQLDFEFD